MWSYGTHPDPDEAYRIRTLEYELLEQEFSQMPDEKLLIARFVQALSIDALEGYRGARDLYYWWLRDHPEQIKTAISKANILERGVTAEAAQLIYNHGFTPRYTIHLWRLICSVLYPDRAELYRQFKFVPRPNILDVPHEEALINAHVALTEGVEDHFYLLEFQESMTHILQCAFCRNELDSVNFLEAPVCMITSRSLAIWRHIVQPELRQMTRIHHRRCVGCRLVVAEARQAEYW